jgi:MFS family permease
MSLGRKAEMAGGPGAGGTPWAGAALRIRVRIESSSPITDPHGVAAVAATARPFTEATDPVTLYPDPTPAVVSAPAEAPAQPPAAAPPAEAPAVRADGVWAPGRRRLTAGLVLTVTLVAFESLAIATIMPLVADDLGGLGLYGWVFSGFFLGSLLGIVVAGQLADRRGTRMPLALGLALFSVGLVVGGLAPTMAVLVLGRVAQGMGAGVVPAVAYTSVGRAYPASLRPRVFAVFSSAWVIPGLAGPAAAGAIEHASSWRFVFLALLPLVALAAAMALPALSGTAPGVEGGADRAEGRIGWALLLVVGVALVLAGLGASNLVAAVALVALGGPVAARAFLRLVPEGTVRLRTGLPSAVAARGLLTFAFFGTDAFISLALTDALDQPTWVAGLTLTLSTLAWTAGAWMQERLVVERGPRWLVRRGMAVIAVAIAGTIAGLSLVPAVVVVAWTLAGLGIGLCYAPISVTVLGTAPAGEEGRASASLQLTDVLGVSLGTGIAGVFVAAGEAADWGTATSLQLGFLVTLAVAAGGAWAAGRLPRCLD